MKELVYHPHLLPTAERYADKVAVYDGPFRATYAEHVDRVLRLGDALQNELGLRPRRPFRRDGPEQPRISRAVPRRLPRRRDREPLEPPLGAQGARVHPA
jgi:hypothetical protein